MLDKILLLSLPYLTVAWFSNPCPIVSNRANIIPFKRCFKYNFTDVDAKKGIKHIHFIEHVTDVHRLGAIGFEIISVEYPIGNSIRYECKTMGKRFNVLQYSNKIYQSELIFYDREQAEHPFLKLHFSVKPYNNNQSHLLFIAFIFWNPLHLLLTPLLPIFVLINGIEDRMYFSNDNKKLVIKSYPKFKQYRSQVYKKYIDEKNQKITKL